MVILVTGASRGLGRALALHYAKQGARVAAVARSRAELGTLGAQVLADAPDGVLRPYRADVRVRSQIEAAIDAIERELGPIDLAIVNAGIGGQSQRAELDAVSFARIIDTNCVGAINTLAPLVGRMRERRAGRLVVVSSLAALQPLPRLGAYGASKAALNHVLESLRIELKPHGVHVTTVCPGFIDTTMLEGQNVPSGWIVPLPRAIERTTRAIRAGRRRSCFPLSLHLLLRILALVPAPVKDVLFEHIFDRLFPPPSGGPRADAPGTAVQRYP